MANSGYGEYGTVGQGLHITRNKPKKRGRKPRRIPRRGESVERVIQMVEREAEAMAARDKDALLRLAIEYESYRATQTAQRLRDAAVKL